MTLAALPMNSVAVGWALLLGAAVWTLRDVWKSSATRTVGWKWWGLLAVAIFSCRWPLFFVPHQQNPDESQLIAGALTLRHDPIFWRSVDGGTAGPLDYYPLLPAAWGDGPASYAIARAIAAAVIFATLFFAGEALAKFAGATVARVAVLPAAAFSAFTTHPDFNHYSTELMPALLLAAAGYAAVHHGQTPSRTALWWCALLAGSVPWAKLQAVPLTAALWGVVAAREIAAGRSRSLAPLVGGALLPTLLCMGGATLTGEIENLVVPFFLQNLAYVDAPQFTWFSVAALQWDNARLDGYLAIVLASSGVTVLLAGVCWRKSTPVLLRRATIVALGLLAAGLLSALGPRRPSTHHLHLIVLPLVWLTGAALSVAWSRHGTRVRQLAVTAGFLACGVVPQFAWRVWAPDPFAEINASGISDERRQLAALVRTLSGQDEPLAMWGWRCSLYVEAGRRQATRQAQTEAQIYVSRLQPYFLRRYLEDFQASNAPVFVDAVGPGNFAFDSPRQTHENFPPLRDWVRARYTYVAALDGTRVYARHDRLAVRRANVP